MKLVLEDSQGKADVISGQIEFLMQLFSILSKNDMQIQNSSEHMIPINPIKREFIRDKFCPFENGSLHPLVVNSRRKKPQMQEFYSVLAKTINQRRNTSYNVTAT